MYYSMYPVIINIFLFHYLQLQTLSSLTNSKYHFIREHRLGIDYTLFDRVQLTFRVRANQEANSVFFLDVISKITPSL